MIVRVSGTLRRYVGFQNQFEIDAPTVREGLNRLADDKPNLKPLLFDNTGKLRSLFCIFINSELARPEDFDRTLTGRDEVEIMTAIAGG